MMLFRLDVSRKSGEVMLWRETPWGLKPIIGWADVEGVKEFAEMLLDFYNRTNEERDKFKEVSDKLLSQALDDEEYFEGET